MEFIEAKLRSENAYQFKFRHVHFWGWCQAVFALLLLALIYGTEPSGFQALKAWAVLCVVSGISLMMICFRDRVDLDTRRRRYVRQRGLAWALTTELGSFEDIEGVALKFVEPEFPFLWKLLRRPKLWRIELEFRTPQEGPVLFGAWSGESSAYAELERFARALSLPALDLTTGDEPRELDLGLVGAKGAVLDPDANEAAALEEAEPSKAEPDSVYGDPVALSAALGIPPTESGIELRGRAGRETLRLPQVVPWGGRYQIERLGNYLRFSIARRGRRLDSCVLHLREIREVELRPPLFSRGAKRQLFLRSARGVLRFGLHLERRSLEWLLEAVRLMAKPPAGATVAG